MTVKWWPNSVVIKKCVSFTAVYITLSIPCTSCSVEKDKRRDKRQKNGKNKEWRNGAHEGRTYYKDKKERGNKENVEIMGDRNKKRGKKIRECSDE